MTGTVNGGYGDGAGRFTLGDDSKPAGLEQWITKDYSVPTGTCSMWVKIGGTVTRLDTAFAQTSTNVIDALKTIGSATTDEQLQRTGAPGGVIQAVLFLNTAPAGTQELAIVFDLALSGDEDSTVDGYDTSHDFGAVATLQEFLVESLNEGTGIRFGESNSTSLATLTAGLVPLSAANTDPFNAIDTLSEGASLGGDGALVFRGTTTNTNSALTTIVYFPIEAGGDDWQVDVLPL